MGHVRLWRLEGKRTFNIFSYFHISDRNKLNVIHRIEFVPRRGIFINNRIDSN